MQHVQMFRPWGSGMPETDDFYDLCDRYGILVMQEWPTAWNSHVTQPYDLLEETVRRTTLPHKESSVAGYVRRRERIQRALRSRHRYDGPAEHRAR